ncbi:MAG: leucyl/phenylalanyl-tRNA--protein transferase [Rhodobacteraceae bacterium]|nr:leucyl/phenylalanyl-tRNA--protein transferase [Paracoccaceae bacterium]
MRGGDDSAAAVTPDLLLAAYRAGLFPMAESRDSDVLFWLDPRQRGIFPLDRFHISRSLARRMRRGGFTVTTDRAFAQVLDACADRPETWINAPIRALFLALHARGHAHSLEVRDNRDGALMGGVYGLAIGAAFFGESMFSARRDGSKIALAWLVHRLRAGGFRLFDTQFLTPHLASLGAIEVPRATYRALLRAALAQDADFNAVRHMPSAQDVMQDITQTS